jgi:predicted DNA binding protein
MGTGREPTDERAGAAPEGIRAGVAIHGAGNCPVVAASTAHDGPITGVNWTHAGDTHTEEFRARDPDAIDRAADVPGAASVVDLGGERVYRYDRPRDGECACRVIEELDCPIADARAEDGVLLLTLHLPDLERLRDVISALDGIADGVEVRYLVHGAADGDAASDRTLVDRGRLTDRQCEVLRTAYRMGYFERPRDANARAVAEALDIAPSTFAEHLAAAQRKLLEETLAGG